MKENTKMQIVYSNLEHKMLNGKSLRKVEKKRMLYIDIYGRKKIFSKTETVHKF